VAHSVDHLANLMDEVAVLLHDHGEEHWAEWIEADARAVRARDGWIGTPRLQILDGFLRIRASPHYSDGSATPTFRDYGCEASRRARVATRPDRSGGP